jgi:flagellar motility protein MotE (MotC chaperone)
MPRFRITTVLFVLLLMTFTVRLGDLLVEMVTGMTPQVKASEALAEEASGDKKEEAKKEEKKDSKDAKDPNKDRQEIPAPKGVAAEPEVKGVEKDPFMQEYSDEELKVLQSLSKRREQIDQREHDLDQREKLLQAAEKKVDEKVAELAKLKAELNNLMDKQQKMEAERIAQLVKIYENMKPKDAANIFNEMDFEVLLGIVDHMSERKVSPIMAAMNPDRAREVSKKLAEEHSLPKKDADPSAPPPAK